MRTTRTNAVRHTCINGCLLAARRMVPMIVARTRPWRLILTVVVGTRTWRLTFIARWSFSRGVPRIVARTRPRRLYRIIINPHILCAVTVLRKHLRSPIKLYPRVVAHKLSAQPPVRSHRGDVGLGLRLWFTQAFCALQVGTTLCAVRKPVVFDETVTRGTREEVAGVSSHSRGSRRRHRCVDCAAASIHIHRCRWWQWRPVFRISSPEVGWCEQCVISHTRPWVGSFANFPCLHGVVLRLVANTGVEAHMALYWHAVP